MIQTFKKAERLCSRKAIEALFEKGKNFYISNYQVIWLESPIDIPFPAQVAFSVSKKLFKRAVKRNIIKRRMREVYRKNKNLLYEALEKKNKKIIFILIYKGDSIPEYLSVELSLIEIINRLIPEINR